MKDKVFFGYCGDELFIKYFGSHCPRKPFFLLPENQKYKFGVIDTWNKTKETVVIGAGGITCIDLKESKEGIALLATAE